jgi:hypothetical protein
VLVDVPVELEIELFVPEVFEVCCPLVELCVLLVPLVVELVMLFELEALTLRLFVIKVYSTEFV